MTEDQKELGLKEIILIVQDYFRHILSKWKLILIGAIFLSVVFGLYAHFTEPKYRAHITFIVNEESESSSLKLPSALSAFGLSGGSKGGGVNLDRIIALANSDNILFQLFLTRSQETGNLIANDLISTYGLEEARKPISKISGDSIKLLSFEEKRSLKRLKVFTTNLNSEILTVSYDDITSIISISAETRNETLSLDLCENLYDILSKFYTHQSISKAEESVQLLQTRLDSVKKELYKSEMDLANIKDKSLGIYYNTDRVREYRNNRDVSIQNTMYIEILKNLEIAKYKLLTVTPLFTIIDSSFRPIRFIKPNLKKNILIGGVLGAVILILILLIKKMYNNIML